MAPLWQAPTLDTNIRLCCKSIEVANALDYFDMATIMTVKSFAIQAPGAETVTLMIPH